MKRTFQRPLALILTLVMLLGLLPGTALALGETTKSGDVTVDNTGWLDAGWGGLTPTISSETDGSLKVEVSEPTSETSWYSVALQKALSSIAGVGGVTMGYTGIGGTAPTQFEAYLGGGNPWVQYKATGTSSGGTVTFADFYKKNDDDGSFESTASDLSNFSPVQLVIVIGGGSMLPSPMALSNITITAPTAKTQCTVTLSATEDVNPKGSPAENFTKAAFSIDGTTPVNDTSLTVDSSTKITVLGAVWLSGTAGDYLDSVTVNNQVQAITKGEDFEFTVTDANTSIVADYKYLADKPGGTDLRRTAIRSQSASAQQKAGPKKPVTSYRRCFPLTAHLSLVRRSRLIKTR